MIVLLLSILVIYGILIYKLYMGFDRVRNFETRYDQPKTTFSVVIPFRNEVVNLKVLLNALSEINYPCEFFEIILVNDDSQDDSLNVIKKFNVHHSTLNLKIIKNYRRSKSPKKDAITTAMEVAKHDWIVTTDADCIVQNTWLTMLNTFIINSEAKMVVAPVNYHSINSFFDHFQWLDIMSLQAATVGGFGLNKPFLCNGANLAYQKALFVELQGFTHNDNIASGDDIFLMEKAIRKYPTKVAYLKNKDATVFTKSESNLSNLFQQRIRWAAKSSAYKNHFGKLVGLIILLMNAAIIVALLLPFISTTASTYSYIVLMFFFKILIDALLIQKAVRFQHQFICWKFYLISCLLYPFFVISVAVYAMFFNYKWKGRSYKK